MFLRKRWKLRQQEESELKSNKKSSVKRKKTKFKMAAYSGEGGKLKSDLREKLPDLDDRIIKELLDTLLGLGVTEMADLKYVTAEKLTPPLNEVQARKLLRDYSGDFISAREQYELELLGQDLKFIEMQKDTETHKMEYKGEIITNRTDIQKIIANQNTEIHNKAVSAADSEDKTLIAGGASYGAGLGATIGIIGGPLGMATGAAIGATLEAGLCSVISTDTRDARVEKKEEVYSQRAAEGLERLMEMDRDLERKDEECKLITDVNRAMLEFKNS